MESSFVAAVDALRRPEYTGENRCMPCTLVNAVIAVVMAAGVGAAVPFDLLGSAAVGGIVLVLSAVAITFRGYLVPGTPWFTETFFPEWVLRYFEHGESPTVADSAVEPAAVLDAAGAVTECRDVDDLCLTDEFRAEWHTQMDSLQGSDASGTELASMLDLQTEDVEFQEHGSAFVAYATGEAVPSRHRVGQWESSGAFIADMAGARVLEQRFAGWDGLDTVERGRVLNGLRVFLDQCPSCGGTVRFGEETVQSCCRSKEVAAVTCQDCGDRLFEAEQRAAA